MKYKHSTTLRCKDVAKHICENLDEKMNSPLCRKIKKHLLECPDCSDNLTSLKKTVHLYQSYPDPTVSKQCHKNLLAVLSGLRKDK